MEELYTAIRNLSSVGGIGILAYVLIINLAGYLSMWYDKNQAKKQAWRVKERTLFLIAVLGGSIGSILGMWTFRHKTKHWYFVVGMPLILIIQIAGIISYFYYF